MEMRGHNDPRLEAVSLRNDPTPVNQKPAKGRLKSTKPRDIHPASTSGPPRPSHPGEVAEWLNAPHSKCGIRATVSGVRISPSPPHYSAKRLICLNKSPKPQS